MGFRRKATRERSALQKDLPRRELPGIFSSYSDTAYAAQQKGALANIAQYFTSSELSEFVDGYLQEGYFNSDGALYLLPVAK